MMHIRSAFAAVLAAMVIAGCTPATQTTLPNPPAEPNPEGAKTAPDRVRGLAGLAAQYDANAKRLPGSNRAEDRKLVAEQFGLLAQMLPMLVGAEPAGDVRQQLRIVEATRAQLAEGPAELSIEPTVGAGLRAAWQTLRTINQRLFTDIPKVGETIDKMRARVDELDSVSGAIHRQVAAQAIAESAEVINLMSETLAKRLVNEPETKPATAPATQPATAPVAEKKAE